MDKKVFCVLMKHCFLEKKNTGEAKTWIDEHYSDSALVKSTIKKWFTKFERGEMSIEDNARSGHPKEAIFNRNKDEFFRRCITMDVTWLLHNTLESNRQSVEYTF
jgi:hypothetical protein